MSPKIIGILHVLSVVVISLATVAFVAGAFNASAGSGAVTLPILGQLFFVFATAYT